jgi:hypothetical protein
MEMYQFFTLVGMLAAGFGWVIHQINGLDKRLTSLETRVSVIETILAMMGMPVKPGKGN